MTVRAQTDAFDAADLLQRAAPDIAHDLNNLRAIVQGNLRLAREDARVSNLERLAEPLADVDMAFQLLVAQVQGVLALARSAGPRSSAPHSLPAVLTKVEALARWALPPHFGIAMPTPSAGLMVSADRELLQGALLSLVLLARDAAPTGGDAAVTVAEAPGAAGRQVTVCVEIPGSLPGGDAARDSPAGRKFALRFELALALARRAVAPAGDVLVGKTAAGRGFVCLQLPLATPGADS
jgi:signal transduction histidine kinase